MAKATAKTTVQNIRIDEDLKSMIDHHAKQIGEAPSVAARQLMRAGYYATYEDEEMDPGRGK